MGLPETGCAVASIRGVQRSALSLSVDHRAVRVAGYDSTDVGEELTADRRVPDRDRVRVDVHTITGGRGPVKVTVMSSLMSPGVPLSSVTSPLVRLVSPVLQTS